jgi:Na+-translocating ferredoxin:NAD+ oxidoreductase RnfG subunit
MFNKLRIAGTLLIIGIISGLSIWGTHELTKDDIAANRRAAQFEIYVDMFPDMFIPEDIGEITEDIENNIIKEKITVEDSSGNLLGYILKGSETNSQGFIEVIIGVETNGEIIDVQISSTENTPNYVQDLMPYIDNFSGQSLQDVSYDASTGSTVTYDSIKKMIEASVLLVQGDPAEEVYQEVFVDYNYYQERFSFVDKEFNTEYTIYDADDNALGYSYTATVSFDGSDYDVAIIVDTDNTYLGYAAVDQGAPDALITELDAFSDLDGDIESITLDGTYDETLETNFVTIQTFLTNSTRVNEEYLVYYETLLNDSEDSIGRRYIGVAEGYSGANTIAVELLDDGTIQDIIVLASSDTEDIYNVGENPLYNDGWADYLGTNSVDGMVDDVFAGATLSGNSVANIVNAAITHLEGSAE